MLDVVAQTAAGLRAASDKCLNRLLEIEQKIEATSTLDGLRVLGFRLQECLQGLREQALHDREQMSQVLAPLREQMARSLKDASSFRLPRSLDALTGLEAREGAERALVEAKERGSPVMVAVFVVNRVHMINADYGYATGDHILTLAHAHLASLLLEEDQLFRWTGPVFVALLKRSAEHLPGTVETVEGVARTPLQATVQIGNGSVRIPVAITPMILDLSQSGSLDDLSQQIDTFIAKQARH